LDALTSTETGFTQDSSPDKCRHRFCNKCLITYLNLKINTGNILNIKCPALNCDCTLSKSTIAKLLLNDKDSYENYTKKLHQCDEAEAVGDLVKQGHIMKCPQCGIYLERADSGCQMIRCFFCRLDICWLTKKPRWGPGGKGDISAGCRCGVDGVKCHSECKNCH